MSLRDNFTRVGDMNRSHSTVSEVKDGEKIGKKRIRARDQGTVVRSIEAGQCGGGHTKVQATP